MAKIIKVKGDATDVQTDFNHAPVGLCVAKAAEVAQAVSNNTGDDMVSVRWEVTADVKDGKRTKLKDAKGKPTSYASIFYYAPIDLTGDISPGWARRLKELLVAYGLPMKGANLAKIEGKEALLRLREDEDQEGDYRPRIGKILSLKSLTDGDDDEEDEPDEEEAEEEEGEEEEVDLDEMDRAEMKAFIKENELGVRVLSKDDDDALREKIRAAMPEDEEEEEEEEPEEDEDGVDLDELSRKELRAFIKENELDIKVTAKMSDDDIREKINEAQGEEEEEPDEEEETDDNYDELGLGDLKQECRDRELSDKGKKDTLIARLRKDDLENPV